MLRFQYFDFTDKLIDFIDIIKTHSEKNEVKICNSETI